MTTRSFRQVGQLMVGVTLALVGIGIAAALGFSLDGFLVAYALAATGWAAFLRPCVRVDETGVTLRNIVRDTALTWPAVRGAGSTWSLVVEGPERSYSSWAISGTASPGRDALRRRGATTVPGDVAHVDAAAVAAGLNPPTYGASAAAIAAYVLRERGARPHPGDAVVTRPWVPSSIVLLLAAAAAALTVLL